MIQYLAKPCLSALKAKNVEVYLETLLLVYPHNIPHPFTEYELSSLIARYCQLDVGLDFD